MYPNTEIQYTLTLSHSRRITQYGKRYKTQCLIPSNDHDHVTHGCVPYDLCLTRFQKFHIALNSLCRLSRHLEYNSRLAAFEK